MHRSSAPDHRYYAQVKDRCNGKRAALSEARKILRQACHILAELGDDALAPRLRPLCHGDQTVTAGPAGPRMQPHSPDGDHRGQLPPIRCQPLPASTGQADGLIRLSGRIPARPGTPNQSSCRRGSACAPADLGKAGCLLAPPPAAMAGHPAQKGRKPEPLNQIPHQGLPAPRRLA